jgi:glyoxylase-like metal-dependent hydrolase (beta-lactamase superfamily II)
LETRAVSENIFLIDDNLYSVPMSGAVYCIAAEKKVLIDAGPATSAGTVIQGLSQIGIQADEIDYLILTHIHLDHSGGAGTLLKSMPHAKVLAHHKAIKHLMDPSKLVKSATQAQGEGSLLKNGEVLPVEEQRLVPVHDGDKLKLDDREVLTLLECPGHAPHELCIFESLSHGIFVGDAVGHTVAETDIILPATPPPSFDFRLYLQTLDRLRALKPACIYFAHYGMSNAVAEKLQGAVNELLARDRIIAQAFNEHRPETAAQKVIAHVRDLLKPIRELHPFLYDYWLANDVPVSANEHVRYFSSKIK